MPELPEVHTIASDLKKHVEGYLINKVEISNGCRVYPDNEKYSKQLLKSQIVKIGRVGKNIVLKLSNERFLTFHLAMTGKILLQDVKSPKVPHQKIELHLTKGNKAVLLRFCDVRMFGKTQILNSVEMRKLKEKYGPDMVLEAITTELFISRLKSKNTVVKSALLEQSIVSGLGNIYATDALWMAKIHPETKTKDLNLEQAKTLLGSAREILLEGIKHRGSTLPDEAYVDIFGIPGNHQRYFRIYGKANCPECKTKIEYKKINGRGTYFCPNCQK